MAINLDFVGLNTLTNEPISSSTNTLGYPAGTPTASYINTQIATIPNGTYFAALNIRRNGIYNFPTFKQTRVSQNPLTRYHNRNSIFSYVTEVGEIKQTFNGSSLVQTFREKRGALYQITESVVVSANKPIRLVGSVQRGEDDTGELDRIEILTSFNNENQYFVNEQANRHHGVIYDTVDGYDELTDIYLDGGLDGDDSPFDQFELLKYSQTIYPKAGNSYLDEVRGRPNFESGYWRDLRINRNETGTINNGFGFTIPSQSVWVLDTEDNWATRTLSASAGSFTASIGCDFDFNTNSASAGGFEFGAADISFFAYDADGNDPGVISDYTTAQVGDIVGYRITAEKYSLNSVDGTTRFWNAWSNAMVAGNFRLDPYTANYVTRSAYTATTFVDADPFYLQVNSSTFNEATWKSEFDNLYLHFWAKDIDSNTGGYLYREVDSTQTNRRSVYFSGSTIEVLHSTVFDNQYEDGTTSFHTGSTKALGAVAISHDLDAESTAKGREWNNHIIQLFSNDGSISQAGDIRFRLNGNLRFSPNWSSTSISDTLDFYTTGKTATTLLTTTVAQSKNTNDSFTNGSGPSNLPMGSADRLITFFMKVVGSTTQTIFKFYTYIPALTDNFITGVISGTNLIVTIKSGAKTRVSTFDVSDYIGTLTKYIIFDNSVAGSYAALKLYAYTSSGLVEIAGSEGTSGASPRAALPSSFQQYSLYSIDSDASGGGQILADFAIITGSAFTEADRNLLANSGSTIDLTSSYWTGPDPVAWWRLGNGSSDPANYDGNDGSKDILYDYAGYAGGPYHITASVGFTTTANTGPPRNLTDRIGYHTSSVSEVFVMCATSSTNNVATDYFKNGNIAELALFSGSTSFNGSELAVSPKYCYVDLTSSAVTGQTASLWYAFSGSSDFFAATSSVVANLGTGLAATYTLSSSYASTSRSGSKTQGLVTGGSAVFTFKANQPLQGQGTNQALPGSGILNFVSSAVAGDALSDTFFLGASYNASGSPGILQNSYNSFNASELDTASNLDDQLYAAPSFARRHSLKISSSFGNPFGINPQIGAARNLLEFELFQGTAFWDTPSQSGRNPFYDSYGAYAENIRLFGKDCSVVPEFKISNQIDKYITSGDTVFESTDIPLLEITGGKSGASNSDEVEFFEVYSTTDFLKNFEIIQDDHKGFVDPLALTLKCKAVKKLLPYEGFYPAQRTVDIAKQFYTSYGTHLTFSSSYADGENADYAIQNLLTPLFSPGILFNSIKSGIACDYPIMTGSFDISSLTLDGNTTGSYYINNQFHRRIPFEALIEPEKHLANYSLHSQEPDPRGSIDATVNWNGQGDQKYRLMVSNFLSEVGGFFLENEDYTTIASLPQGDPNFGNAEAGKTYMMRIALYRATAGSKDVWRTDSETYSVNSTYQPPEGTEFGVPQDTGSMTECLTMYSRPSAFGPPQRLTIEGNVGSEQTVQFENWRRYKNQGSIDTFYNVTTASALVITHGAQPDAPFGDLAYQNQGAITPHFLIGNDASSGYNYPFTPPYYHGEGWADIIFKPTETRKYSVEEIIDNSSVEFLRFYEPVRDLSAPPPDYNVNWRLINEDAMQLASSINIFSKGILGQNFKSQTVSDSYRWIIQSKFETPVLNFNKYNYTGSTNKITLPNIAPETTPIGMWHQYGEIPAPQDGIFLKVSDVPDLWIKNAMGGNEFLTSSLADLCGFSSDPVRVGEVKSTKIIKEAVVAIPFIEKNNQREFFKLPKKDIQNALSEDNRLLVGDTIREMVDNMQEFILPHSMDFVRNTDIDPFAMYIFPFEHTLSKQDLANIWQNVSPDIAVSNEESEATISHELLYHELLGEGAQLKVGANKEQDLDRNARLKQLNSQVRWMVFKAKKRAEANYFDKIYERNESNIGKDTDPAVSSTGAKSNVQYNWPYDFFSLVELIKIDAEVDFAQPDEQAQEVGIVAKPIVKTPDRKVKITGNKKNRKRTIKIKGNKR